MRRKRPKLAWLAIPLLALGWLVWLALPRQVAPARVAGAEETRAAVSAGSAEPWIIRDSASGETLRLAMDQAAVRDADGKESLVALDPPATPKTLRFRLARLEKHGAVFPVAYVEGMERSVVSRRVVTPDLRVKLPAGRADRIAAANGLRVKDRPAHAPEWAILSAVDALAALEAVPAVRNADGVESADVLLAAQRFPRAMPNDPLVGQQWHLKRSGTAAAGTDLNVETAWNFPNAGTRGSGVRIGVVDDGLQLNHPDLSPNVDTTLDWDWNGNDADPSPGVGDNHGTATAGIAAARGNNFVGVSGTAPMATLVGLRLIAASTTDAQEAEAMAHRNDAIHIKSNSWGPSDNGGVLEAAGPLTRAAFRNAVDTGRSGRGTIFVWAAGNGAGEGDNSNYDGFANLPETIAVGAIDSLGRRAAYSEPGANLVVCAPSSGDSPALKITTTDRTSGDGYNATTSANGGDYTSTFTGTSAAAPAVAGVVAMMLEKNPQLGWRDVQEILIRSASRFQPASAGWAENSGGLFFHHDFGGGLANATAAVNLAGSWTNLGPRQSAVRAHEDLHLAIPRNSATGITRSFDFSGTDLRVEHVAVTVDLPHPNRGNLAITLTSPSGMTSRLAETHTGSSGGYVGWTFGSVRHWGEHSSGIWTLHIADLGSGSISVGTLGSAEIELSGATSSPVNPRPVVSIVHPLAGKSHTPAAPVTVEVVADDLDISGTEGQIEQVELLLNGAIVAVGDAPPFLFSVSPGAGSHTLVARATDSEGAVGTSMAVDFFVGNQAPQVVSAALSPESPVFDDLPLEVSEVVAEDPEEDEIELAYLWQFSADGQSWVDEPSQTSATLPPVPGSAGKLWRCRITPADASGTGEAFFTAAVNVVRRPPESVPAGAPFAYESGLVLRRAGTGPRRQVILHEFSHGPAGGTSQWLEILALKTGNLGGWSVADAAGNMLTFADAPLWQEISAGTLIVVYRGDSPKDPLLPADDGDPSDGRIVVSSADAALFSGAGTWLDLPYAGGALALLDSTAEEVHRLSYGGNATGRPALGALGDGMSAAFTGDSDESADAAASWRVHSSHVSRRGTKAAGDPFISEYVEGSGDNKALEIFNPGAVPVDLGALGYRIDIHVNGATSAQWIVSLSGVLAPGGTHVVKHPNASAGITAQQASSSLSFDGNDAIVLRSGSTLLDRIGRVGQNPGAAWTANGVSTLNQTLRRKPSVVTGDPNLSAPFDPSLEWNAFPQDDFSGLGSHGTGPAAELTLVVDPPAVMENAGGGAATGTVSLPSAAGVPIAVTLASSLPERVGVPVQVEIPAGELVANFAVDTFDNTFVDGDAIAVIEAAAAGYGAAVFEVTVVDDEHPDEGVSPGKANGPANAAMVGHLRDGTYAGPALFRLGNGSVLPDGLELDEMSGRIAGVPLTPADAVPIEIERYNGLGESVSLSFVLAVSPGGFDTWIGGFSGISETSATADPDRDGLANLLEHALGGHPGHRDAADLLAWERSESGIAIVYRRSKTAAGTGLSAEWSPAPGVAVWRTEGIVDERIEDAPDHEIRRAFLALEAQEPRKFMRLRAFTEP